MKLSKLDQSLIGHATELTVIPYSSWIFRTDGYAIMIRNSVGGVTLAPGGRTKVWKTQGGAIRAASKLRPDLLASGNGITIEGN